MEKRYLIIACPRCHTIQVVDGRNRTKTCASCGRRVQVGGLRILGTGKDAREARGVVAALKAQQANQ